MAGTRGLPRFRGEQLNDGILRNSHFDEANKINERYLEIDFHNHRESLEDTKIDVWSQINGKVVTGLSSLVLTELQDLPVADVNVEGVVTSTDVEVRISGTEDTAEKDSDADRVYGKLTELGGVYTVTFYSKVNNVETAYTFGSTPVSVDLRYARRTNLAVIPVDSLLNGGAGFVEGATDARAYMNILQLAKDLYGVTYSLDNDGNPNLPKDIVTQINELSTSLETAVQNLRDDLAAETGSTLVGVSSDAHYTGATVQAVLSELARLIFIIQTEEQEEVYEAVGGETGYTFVNGVAKPGTVMVFINGQLQAPTINFVYTKDVSDNITGIDFTPDTLRIVNGIPDVLFVKYKKLITP